MLFLLLDRQGRKVAVAISNEIDISLVKTVKDKEKHMIGKAVIIML
jgi:hypothetical protein